MRNLTMRLLIEKRLVTTDIQHTPYFPLDIVIQFPTLHPISSLGYCVLPSVPSAHFKAIYHTPRSACPANDAPHPHSLVAPFHQRFLSVDQSTQFCGFSCTYNIISCGTSMLI